MVSIVRLLEDEVYSADSGPLFRRSLTEVQLHRRRLVGLGNILEVHGLLLRAQLMLHEAQLLVLLRCNQHHPITSMQLALSCALAAAIELFENHELAAVHAFWWESCGVGWILVARFS